MAFIWRIKTRYRGGGGEKGRSLKQGWIPYKVEKADVKFDAGKIKRSFLKLRRPPPLGEKKQRGGRRHEIGDERVKDRG